MTTRLEDLKPDAQVKGLVGREAVWIVSAEMLGEAACKVVYRGQDGALADRRAWQRITDNALELNLSVAQKDQAIKKVKEATTAVASRIPETWCHLLIPYQQAPGPNGAQWDDNSSAVARAASASGAVRSASRKTCCSIR
jgi:hypothetical protein